MEALNSKGTVWSADFMTSDKARGHETEGTTFQVIGFLPPLLLPRLLQTGEGKNQGNIFRFIKPSTELCPRCQPHQAPSSAWLKTVGSPAAPCWPEAVLALPRCLQKMLQFLGMGPSAYGLCLFTECTKQKVTEIRRMGKATEELSARVHWPQL